MYNPYNQKLWDNYKLLGKFITKSYEKYVQFLYQKLWEKLKNYRYMTRSYVYDP